MSPLRESNQMLELKESKTNFNRNLHINKSHFKGYQLGAKAHNKRLSITLMN